MQIIPGGVARVFILSTTARKSSRNKPPPSVPPSPEGDGVDCYHGDACWECVASLWRCVQNAEKPNSSC